MVGGRRPATGQPGANGAAGRNRRRADLRRVFSVGNVDAFRRQGGSAGRSGAQGAGPATFAL